MVNLRGATLIVSSVILIAFAILALTLIDTSERLEGQATKIGMSGYGARLATELKTQVLLHNRRSFLYSMKKTQALEQNVEIGRQRIWHLLEEAAHFLGSKEEEVLFSEVKMGVAAYLEKRDQLQKEKLSSVDRYDQASKYVERSFESIDRFIELNIVEMTDGLDSTHAVNKVAKQRALIILFIGFILVIGIIFFIFFSILRPLSNLAAIIANYGTENSTAISDVKGVREIQSIFLHLQSMAQRLEKTALDLAKERLKLERSNRELEQFAGVAAHDLRSPIATIFSWTDMLQHLIPTPRTAEVEQALTIIRNNAKKAGDLVDDVLEIARVNVSDPKIDKVDLRQTLRGILVTLAPEIESTQAKIQIGSMPVVQGNQTYLDSVFSNLLRNALIYREKTRIPEISVGYLEHLDSYEFFVTDNGIGIEPQFVTRIFEMFKRLNGEKEYPGTGIGLAFCKKVVEHSGGRIWVESVPGQGSTFRFTYPKGWGA